MNDGKSAQLSMLMDGEIDGLTEQSVGEIINSEAGRETWRRYHLISDALRQELPEYTDIRLADRVLDSIKHEPAILAPGNIQSRPYLKPLAGLAIAASVTALAILGIQQMGDGQEGLDTGPALAQQSTVEPEPPVRQFTFPARPASMEVQSPQYRPNAASSRLNSYLVNYNETHSGMRGMLPYVRIIAHENEK